MSDVVYCGQCGNENPTSNRFCGKCGATLGNLLEKLSSVPSLTPLVSHPNICPKCKSIDQIQKLSTIVTAGTRNTSGVSATMEGANLVGSQRHYAQKGGYVGSSELSGKAYSASSTLINATEQSNLAKRLSPPREPQEPELNRPGFGEWYSNAVGTVGLVVSIAGLLWLAKPWGVIGGIVGVIGGMVVSVTLFFLFESLVFGSSRKRAKEQFEIEKQKYARDILAWEKAEQRWETMYYCYRDDVVFVPGENAAVTPNHLIAFCYKNR